MHLDETTVSVVWPQIRNK